MSAKSKDLALCQYLGAHLEHTNMNGCWTCKFSLLMAFFGFLTSFVDNNKEILLMDICQTVHGVLKLPAVYILREF